MEKETNFLALFNAFWRFAKASKFNGIYAKSNFKFCNFFFFLRAKGKFSQINFLFKNDLFRNLKLLLIFQKNSKKRKKKLQTYFKVFKNFEFKDAISKKQSSYAFADKSQSQTLRENVLNFLYLNN
jgi:hypothetical protein